MMSAVDLRTEPTRERILLLEDEVHVATVLQVVLKEAGYRVDWAATGQKALELLAQASYDLLLADLYLPDMDGLEVVRVAREQRPQLKVIVMTGYSSLTSAVAALRLGTSDYLEKPFTEQEITAAIEKVLQQEGEGGLPPDNLPTPVWKF